MTGFGEATEIAKAAGAEPPVLELRADEVEAVAIARKGAFYYRARHGRAGEKRARELEAFADAAFEWQHSGGAAPPPVLEEDEQGAELEDEDLEELAAPGLDEAKAGPTARARSSES